MMLLFLFSQAARLEADDGVYTWSEMSGQNLPQLGWMQIGLKNMDKYGSYPLVI